MLFDYLYFLSVLLSLGKETQKSNKHTPFLTITSETVVPAGIAVIERRGLDFLLAWFRAVPAAWSTSYTYYYRIPICTQCYVYLVRYPDNDMYIVANTFYNITCGGIPGIRAPGTTVY